ncbi:MAG: hypothetical protein ACOC0G_00905 [Thermodesulfobacteriota bacterium]
MKRILLLVSLCVIGLSGNIRAQDTTLTVRAKANDAKFIGTAMGGVQVRVTHALTRELLAQGLIQGGTGSTETLMEKPVARGERLSNASAAAFKTVLDIEEPTPVDISLHGPLAGGGTGVDASKRIWILPGKDIVGDGIVFDLYGFVVTPLAPHANTKFASGEEIELKAYVTMLCGCPISSGGMWDADNYTVEAQIWDDESLVDRVAMRIGDGDGVFSATYKARAAGSYRVIFTAADSATNNYAAAYTGIAVK